MVGIVDGSGGTAAAEIFAAVEVVIVEGDCSESAAKADSATKAAKANAQTVFSVIWTFFLLTPGKIVTAESS